MVLLVCGSIALIPFLRVDFRVSTFFPKGDKQLDFYQQYSSKMGSFDPFVFCAIEARNSIYNPSFINKIDQFTKECRELPFVDNSISITNAKRYNKTPFGLLSLPYLHVDDPDKFPEDSIRILKDQFLTQRFLSENGKYLSVLIQLEKNLDLVQVDSFVQSLDSLVLSHDYKNTHLLGRKYMEVLYKRIVTEELKQSLILSLIIMIFFLALLYRSFSGIILPVVSMISALLILYGFLVLSGRSLGILANLFPTIMLIVGISDVIHILNKYSLETDAGHSKKEAIRKTIKEIGVTTFLTSFTTAAGFLTLATSSMPAIYNFGISAAIGVLIAYAVSIIFVPAILLTLGLKIPIKGRLFSEKWNTISKRIFKFNIKHFKSLFHGSIIISLIAIIGIFQIDTNNHQLGNIPENHRLKADYTIFEQNMGGARSFEMAVICKNKFNLESLAQIRELHNYLDSLPELNSVYSPISFYHGVSRIYDKSLSLFALPDSDSKLKSYVKKMDKSVTGTDWKLVDSTQTIGRISARMNDLGRLEVSDLNTQIRKWITNNIDESKFQFHFTGTDFLVDRGHELRIKNMGVGLTIAILVVALLMGFLYKDIRIVLITLIVNILPVLMVAGVMGYSGIELRGHSSIIFTIAFVIAVDDTIHFLSKFKLERQKGNSVQEAVKLSMQETLRAIIVTSVILFGGFFVLVHSDFWDVYVVGILVSATLVFALIVDMFLLPILLIRFMKE